MTLSSSTIETLIDLLEIKLSCFEVWDSQDKRELKKLQTALKELHLGRVAGGPGRRAPSRPTATAAIG